MNETQTSADQYVVDLVESNIGTAVFYSLLPVVIEFCTPGSGSSHIMSPCFVDLSQKYADNARFFRINIETYPEAAGRFEVTSVPCFVFVSEGEVMTRLYGVTPRCDIENKLVEILKE